MLIQDISKIKHKGWNIYIDKKKCFTFIPKFFLLNFNFFTCMPTFRIASMLFDINFSICHLMSFDFYQFWHFSSTMYVLLGWEKNQAFATDHTPNILTEMKATLRTLFAGLFLNKVRTLTKSFSILEEKNCQNKVT